MNKPKLYTTPIIVGWIITAIGVLAAFNLAYVPLIFPKFDGFGGGFAILMIGVFVAIMGICVVAVYAKLNKDFARMLSGDTLLTYTMTPDLYMFFTQKQAEDIKAGNKVTLFTILGFCVLFGVLLGLLVDTLFIIIFLAIAVFFTIVYFLATALRTGKVKKSQALVCLNGGGAYIYGEMHSWTMAGTWLTSVDYVDGPAAGLPCSVIQIAYTGFTGRIIQERSVTIPIPPQLLGQGQWAVTTLKGMYRMA